jgi:hypothetical protein
MSIIFAIAIARLGFLSHSLGVFRVGPYLILLFFSNKSIKARRKEGQF